MAWLGVVALRPGRLVYSGRLGPSHPHAHASVLLMVARSGRCVLEDGHGRRRLATAAVVPVGARHTVRGPLAECLMVYMEPDCAASRALADRLSAAGDPSSLDCWLAAAEPLWGLGPDLPGDDPDAAADRALISLVGPSGLCQSALRNPVLGHALKVLPDMLSESIRLPDVATRVALSPGRLGRLFADELGLSFPAYVRWLRMRSAIEFIRQGRSLTDAANMAGFTDSAHLTRVFNEMFGMSPRTVARRVDWR